MIMACCHADFAALEGSDRGFTLGMPTFTFGPGVLAEAGDNAAELGLSRVALFTDRRLSAGEHVAKAKASLAAAKVDCVVYDEVAVEPTDKSFQDAARFAKEANADGFVSVGGGSVMDTCKAANLYASHPAEFMTYVNAPIGGGQRVPGPVKPHIACPTTSGTGSETTGIAIFTLTSMNAKTGIISRRLIPTVALVDPDVTRTLPANVVASTGFDCMSHALESMTARLYPRRLNPAQGIRRPVSQGANPFSDTLATQALQGVGRFLVRAVKDASDTEARTEMMYAA
ncbi:MAG TPA: iron-containing alcohol dehydrogenase, partial [Casimicrobiaceae bacterium]|nr:iron-containing alcohol dehydrogenase [Casimicrobiaceae bacterium]